MLESGLIKLYSRTVAGPKSKPTGDRNQNECREKFMKTKHRMMTRYFLNFYPWHKYVKMGISYDPLEMGPI